MNFMSKTPRIELLLHPNEVLHLNNRKQPFAVSCKNGMIWLTCEGETRDQVLGPGRRYIPKTKGNVVIEAIGEACIGIEENLN